MSFANWTSYIPGAGSRTLLWSRNPGGVATTGTLVFPYVRPSLPPPPSNLKLKASAWFFEGELLDVFSLQLFLQPLPEPLNARQVSFHHLTSVGCLTSLPDMRVGWEKDQPPAGERTLWPYPKQAVFSLSRGRERSGVQPDRVTAVKMSPLSQKVLSLIDGILCFPGRGGD